MDVHLRLAPGLAQQVGHARFTLTLAEGATVADAVRQLQADHPQAGALLDSAIPVIAGRLASRATALSTGQELALLLPVAGGSLHIHVVRVDKKKEHP